MLWCDCSPARTLRVCGEVECYSVISHTGHSDDDSNDRDSGANDNVYDNDDGDGNDEGEDSRTPALATFL